MSYPALYYTAKSYVHAGLSIIPIASNGSKAPDTGLLAAATASFRWEPYIRERPSDEDLKTWFATEGAAGIGIVGGAVSGNLERIDYDHAGIYDRWYALSEQCGLGDLVSSLPLVQTPRADDCYHLYYRCEEPVGKNQVLAKARIEDGTYKTAIETRGEAGYTLAPGSPGACHPTGREYVLMRGDLTNIPVITKQQRDVLLELARSFNEDVQEVKPSRPADTADPNALRPGDDYNERGDFRNVLEQHGWSSWDNNGTEYWTRPGKDYGVSASFNHQGNNSFYVFSTNAEPFQPGNSYSPFGVYATLEHDGDFAGAARSLREQGYGEDAGTVNVIVGANKNRQPTQEDIDEILARVEEAKAKNTAAAAYEVIDDIARLPDGVRDDVLHDISTSIKALRRSEIEKRVEKQRRRAKRSEELQTTRPMLVLNHRQQREVIFDATDILLEHNDPPYLFARDEGIVRLVSSSNGDVLITPVEKDTLSARLINIADVVTVSEEGNSPATLPDWVSKYVVQAERFPFPRLNGIVYTPILRENADLISDTGYDSATKLYYENRDGCVVPPLPDLVTDREVEQAKELLYEIICDFPFDGEASRTNALAMLITPVLRNLYKGLPQGCLVDAPKQKSGKTLLSLVTAIVATGAEVAGTSAPTQEEEWGKKIISQLQTGAPILIFDNIRNKVTSASLEAALTLPVFEQRLLGTNRILKSSNNSFFIFNGNNVALSDDMATRVFVVRLNPKCSDPECRSGFLHPNLKQWVKENRGRILWAAYVIYKRWYQDGAPDYREVVALGSYEGWSKFIGNILAHAGITGFLGNRDEVKNRLGSSSEQWETFLNDWHERIGGRAITTKQFVSQYQHDLSNSIPDELARALEPFSEHAKHTAVGKVFSAKCEARFGKAGLYLCPAGKSHGAQVWCVRVESEDLLVRVDDPLDEVEIHGSSDASDKPPSNTWAEVQEKSTDQDCELDWNIEE